METKQLAVPLMLWAISVIASCLSAPPASAQPAEQEPAIARTADDVELQWGPCPEFLPEGCQIAVLHGDPGKPNADVFFRVPGKSKLALHWHTSAERMVLLAGELHVSYEGQSPVIMKPGTYAYGPARRPHSGVCASEVPCVLFIAFEAPVDAVPVEGK
jgi:uncharacterized cupin superfamily protein